MVAKFKCLFRRFSIYLGTSALILLATLDYTYNGYGVSRKVLNEAQVPDGNSHMWSITVNPKLRLNRRGNFDPYVVGGVGYYRRTVEFTRPVLIPVFIFDPFFGVFYNTFVQADQVIGKITQDGVGGIWALVATSSLVKVVSSYSLRRGPTTPTRAGFQHGWFR